MDIEIIAPDLRITKLQLTDARASITVDVHLFDIYDPSNPNSLAAVLEKYRGYIRDGKQLAASVLFEQSQGIFDSFITSTTNPYKQFDFDAFFVLFPSDNNRFNLMKRFAEKLIGIIEDWEQKERSGRFRKNNPQVSVVENEDNFSLNVEGLTPIRRLLIIDDVINEGRTINNLLSKLVASKKVNSETEVKLICMYGFKKLGTRRSVLDRLRECLDE